MRALILAAALAATPSFAQVVPASDIPATELEREVARIQAFQGVTIGAQPEPAPSTAEAAPVATAESATHTVVKGDTLFNIAQRNGVTVDALKSVNGLDSAAIALGQTLLIPSATPKTVVVEEESHALNTHTDARVLQANQTAETPVEPRPYAVLPGDTLFSIATRACVGLDALKTANALTETAITPGQRLALPDGHCLK